MKLLAPRTIVPSARRARAAQPPASPRPRPRPPNRPRRAAGCTEITTLLDLIDSFALAYFEEDGVALQAALDAIPDAAEQQPRQPRQPEIADALDTAVAEIPAVMAALEGGARHERHRCRRCRVVVAPARTADTGDADEQVQDWAAENCGWVRVGWTRCSPEPTNPRRARPSTPPRRRQPRGSTSTPATATGALTSTFRGVLDEVVLVRERRHGRSTSRSTTSTWCSTSTWTTWSTTPGTRSVKCWTSTSDRCRRPRSSPASIAHGPGVPCSRRPCRSR